MATEVHGLQFLPCVAPNRVEDVVQYIACYSGMPKVEFETLLQSVFQCKDRPIQGLQLISGPGADSIIPLSSICVHPEKFTGSKYIVQLVDDPHHHSANLDPQASANPKVANLNNQKATYLKYRLHRGLDAAGFRPEDRATVEAFQGKPAQVVQTALASYEITGDVQEFFHTIQICLFLSKDSENSNPDCIEEKSLGDASSQLLDQERSYDDDASLEDHNMHTGSDTYMSIHEPSGSSFERRSSDLRDDIPQLIEVAKAQELITSIEAAILSSYLNDDFILASLDVYEDEANLDELVNSWIVFCAHFLTRSLVKCLALEKFVKAVDCSPVLVVQICRWYLEDHPALCGALDVLASASSSTSSSSSVSEEPNKDWTDFQETLVMLCAGVQTLSPFWNFVMSKLGSNVNDQYTLQKLIQDRNGIVCAAKEVYDLEHNLEDFLDTLHRVIHL